MFTDNKATEIFCLADDFCKFFDSLPKRYPVESSSISPKRMFYHLPKMPKAEIRLILILFDASGYRCLKHYYLEYAWVHLRHLFTEPAPYKRFVELEKDVALTLAIFIKKVLLAKCTGISFADTTTFRS